MGCSRMGKAMSGVRAASDGRMSGAALRFRAAGGPTPVRLVSPTAAWVRGDALDRSPDSRPKGFQSGDGLATVREPDYLRQNQPHRARDFVFRPRVLTPTRAPRTPALTPTERLHTRLLGREEIGQLLSPVHESGGAPLGCRGGKEGVS
jgi:hypothetical protein